MMKLPDPVQHLLAHLAAALDLPQLELDENGVCALEVAQRVTVHVGVDLARQEIVLFGIAGRLPPNAGSAQLMELLDANRFWHLTGGATLALDDETPPRVVLARGCPWDGPSPEQFCERFESLVAYLDQWRTYLEEPQGPAADVAWAMASRA